MNGIKLNRADAHESDRIHARRAQLADDHIVRVQRNIPDNFVDFEGECAGRAQFAKHFPSDVCHLWNHDGINI